MQTFGGKRCELPPELGELELTSFLNALPGAVSQGLIWGIMAIGVYITYKLLDIADLTVDGSFCTGGAVGVMMIVAGCPVGVALVCAVLVGMAAGLVTGLLHTCLLYTSSMPGPISASSSPASSPWSLWASLTMTNSLATTTHRLAFFSYSLPVTIYLVGGAASSCAILHLVAKAVRMREQVA